MLLRLMVLAGLMFMPSMALAGSDQLDTILERLIQAYGGEQNLQKLDNMTQEWDMLALMSNRPGTDVRHVQLPGRLRVILTYPDKTETRMLDGKAAYVAFNDGRPSMARGVQRDAMQLQLMRLYSPLALKQRKDAISITESGNWLALSLEEGGLKTDYLVDKEAWRIEKVAGILAINGNEMRFLTEYSDFRWVEGVLVHHQENKFAGSVNTAKLKLRQIGFAANFAADTFRPQQDD